MSQTLRQRKLLKRLENKGRLLGRKSKLPFEDKVAYFGMVIVQGALLPSHFNGIFPHWSLPTMLVCGLCCLCGLYCMLSLPEQLVDWLTGG